MQTMTSLAAQNQFGTLIDTSQREPVFVTRRGRPVSVVVSFEEYIKSQPVMSLETAKFISENFPLRGEAAAEAMRKHFASMGNKAAEEGLTEDDVMRMLNED